MATSGTYTWDLQVDDVIESAFEHCGLEVTSGRDLAIGKRNLNLLLTSWVNDGVNLWTVDQATIDLTASTQSYTLDSQVVDILDAVSRETASGTDQEMSAVSMSEYLNRPNKDTGGRPVHYTTERNQSGPTLYVWPVPTDTSYDMVVWQIRYPQDSEYTASPDAPRRFYPALTWGLAEWIAIEKMDKVGLERQQLIQNMSSKLYNAAKGEDRERASLYLVPGRSR